jgi:hypothetical protein
MSLVAEPLSHIDALIGRQVDALLKHAMTKALAILEKSFVVIPICIPL